MPAPPRTSVSGVSADNIIEGSRKRARYDTGANGAFFGSPQSSTSRLPDPSSEEPAPGSEEASHLGFKLLDVLINRIDDDGTPLAVPFLALPSRADYPDYYEQIKSPISLEQIRRRLQKRQISTLERVRNQFEAICRNAKRYNLKGSEIYEKARMMHQIILHVYVDLVEKGEVQPAGDIVIRSEPPLEQQSARLAKIEKPAKRARLDYDELEGESVAGRISLRLKRDDDIDYEEDEEEVGDEVAEGKEQDEESQSKKGTPVQQVQVAEEKVGAKAERSTPQIESTIEVGDESEMDGDLSSAPNTYDGDVDMNDSQALDRSMLTLSGKFDRRKRPGPRGKRLKSTLKTLVHELKNALDQSGQPITRFFLTLPSRLQYPDYYKVIQRPIALDSIEDKVLHKDYLNPHALIVDLRQMVENAQYFNEEGSVVWEAAEEIRQYVETTTIPTLLADGFTLDPNDTRQSAMPVDIAANSTIPSQAAAFRIQTERRAAFENGTSTELMESVSPELPGRSLIMPNENKLKVRLGTRGNTSTSPGPLADMQPPIPPPPGSSLGLSMNEGGSNVSQMGMPRSPYGNATSSPGVGMNYSTSSAITATPSSYLHPSLPQSSPGNVLPWASATNNVSPSPAAHSSNTYFSQYPQGMGNGQHQMAGRLPSSSSSMAPPVPAGYPNGSLPFQKPTNLHMPLGGQDANAGLNGSIQGSPSGPSPLLSKRLPGEAPLFDPFQTNILRLDSETTIIREAVISYFTVKVQNNEGGKDKLSYRLRNDVTRIHSISIPSKPAEHMNFLVEMTPLAVKEMENSGKKEGSEDRKWTVSIHHNGKGIRPHWQGEESIEKSIGGGQPASTTTTTSSTRVQIPAGSPCNFNFIPQPGANIVSIHIHPPPQTPALQEIVKDEKHPLRSKAKALLDLSERYRILVYCRP